MLCLQILQRYALYASLQSSSPSGSVLPPYHQGLDYLVLLLTHWADIEPSHTFVALCNLLALQEMAFDCDESDLDARLEVRIVFVDCCDCVFPCLIAYVGNVFFIYKGKERKWCADKRADRDLFSGASLVFFFSTQSKVICSRS